MIGARWRSRPPIHVGAISAHLAHDLLLIHSRHSLISLQITTIPKSRVRLPGTYLDLFGPSRRFDALVGELLGMKTLRLTVGVHPSATRLFVANRRHSYPSSDLDASFDLGNSCFPASLRACHEAFVAAVDRFVSLEPAIGVSVWCEQLQLQSIT